MALSSRGKGLYSAKSLYEAKCDSHAEISEDSHIILQMPPCSLGDGVSRPPFRRDARAKAELRARRGGCNRNSSEPPKEDCNALPPRGQVPPALPPTKGVLLPGQRRQHAKVLVERRAVTAGELKPKTRDSEAMRRAVLPALVTLGQHGRLRWHRPHAAVMVCPWCDRRKVNMHAR